MRELIWCDTPGCAQFRLVFVVEIRSLEDGLLPVPERTRCAMCGSDMEPVERTLDRLQDRK